MSRRLVWLGIGVVVLVSLVVGTRQPDGPPTDLERVQSLTDQMRCPTCRGLSVAESDAPSAEFIEAETRRRVSLGQSDEEIFGYFVDRYGAELILLSPPAEGLGLVVWAVPVAVVIVAVAGVALALRRWRSRAGAPDEEDRALVARALGEPTLGQGDEP